MIKFNKLQNINGFQLRQELNNASVEIDNEISSVYIDADGYLWLNIKDTDKTLALSILNAHIPIDNTVQKAEQKAALLTRLGITAEEATLLLS